MKVQLTLSDELMDRVDKYVKDNYMTRSGLMSFALNQFLTQQEVISLIKQMTLYMRKIADSGKIDDDMLEQLKDFERICKMFMGQRE